MKSTDTSTFSPLVTVAMPVYNAVPHIKKAMDSILEQTLTDFELICVDDESTDGSAETLAEYASADARVRLLHQNHAGAADARNLALSQARGKYIIFVDADDQFESVMLEHACARAEETNAEIVVFDAQKYYMRDGLTKHQKHYLRYDMLPDEEVFSCRDFSDGELLFITISAAWNKLYLLGFIKERHLLFQSLPNSNDTFFMIASMSAAERITVLQEILLTHTCQIEDSLQGSRGRQPLAFIRAYEQASRYLQEQGLYDAVKRGFDNKLIWQAYDEIKFNHRADVKRSIIESLKASFFWNAGILTHQEDYYFAPNRKAFVASALAAWSDATLLDHATPSDENIRLMEDSSQSITLADESYFESGKADKHECYRYFKGWQALAGALASMPDRYGTEAFDLGERAEALLSMAIEAYIRIVPEEQCFYYGLDANEYYAFYILVVRAADSERRRLKLEKANLKNQHLKEKIAGQQAKITAQKEKLIAQEMRGKELNNLKSMLKLQNEKLKECQLSVKRLKSDLRAEKARRQALKNSFSWCLGRMLTWPFRKVYKLLRACTAHGHR